MQSDRTCRRALDHPFRQVAGMGRGVSRRDGGWRHRTSIRRTSRESGAWPVGATRAKRLLGVTCAAEQYGERSNPSPFLFELKGGEERIHAWIGPRPPAPMTVRRYSPWRKNAARTVAKAGTFPCKKMSSPRGQHPLPPSVDPQWTARSRGQGKWLSTASDRDARRKK